MKRWSISLLLVLGMAAAFAATEQGIVVRSAVVYESASSLSPRVGEIRAGSKVSIFSRQGGWKEIYAENPALLGWVRSYQVREGEYAPAVETSAAEADSRGFLSGLASLSRRASRFFRSSGGSTSSSTATIGVRGLSEEELRGAVPDLGELAKMESYASNADRAGEFARQGRLAARKIAHIEPK